ncbi:hypothetical protein THRCLA_21592 [Thraustotheca clavata]|uniref:Uncharacterized protein n=1 Tax=Thraustotheca clavata TaxID=74557 RepID=A0A1V9ZUZ1_9STRA|nr:hypothetical protein THRCLA_21592 [Thraustotheca clavata]
MSNVELVQWTKETFGIGVHTRTISRILQNTKVLNDFNIDIDVTLNQFSYQKPKLPELDRLLYEWLLLWEKVTCLDSPMGGFLILNDDMELKVENCMVNGNLLTLNMPKYLKTLTSLYEKGDIYNFDDETVDWCINQCFWFYKAAYYFDWTIQVVKMLWSKGECYN